MNESFLSILVDPTTDSPLQLNEAKTHLFSLGTNQTFHIEGNVPVILINKLATTNDLTSEHEKSDSGFNYQAHYQKDAEFFDYNNLDESPATTHELRRLQEAILNRITLNDKLLLDVGCGKGWVANLCLPINKQVISMDISTVNPIKALANYPNHNHFGLVADVYHLPIKNNSINCIIAAEIMEHVPDPKRFVATLYNKLKPNGKLLITTPYNEKLTYNLCVHCNRATPQNAHLHSFNETNIKALIPEGAVYKWDKFMNKYLAKLRSHIVLKYLPFVAWKLIDKAFDKLFPKPMRLLIEIQKR